MQPIRPTRPNTPVDMDTGAVAAVTLQEAHLGDATAVQETLAEVGEAVAELIEREGRGQSAGGATTAAGRNRGSRRG